MADITTSLKYGDTLWGNMKLVVAQAEEGDRNLRNLVKFMREKAALDAMYAQKLRKLSRNAIPEMESESKHKSPFADLFKQFHEALSLQAGEYEELSQKINSQIVRPMNNLVDSHFDAINKLKNGVSDWNKRYTSAHSNLERNRTLVERTCLASAKERLKHTELVKAQPHNVNGIESAMTSAAAMTRRALQADVVYVQSVRYMRDFREEFDVSIKNLFNQFQLNVYERMTMTCQFLRHYLTSDGNACSAHHKNVELLVNKATALDPNADIQAFIIKNKTKKVPPPIPIIETFVGHPSYHRDCKRSILSAQLQKSAELKDAEGRLHFYLDKLSVASPMILSSEEKQQAELEEIQKLFASKAGRIALVNVLQETSVRAEQAPDEDEDIATNEGLSLALPSPAFKKLGSIVRSCLDASLESKQYVGYVEQLMSLADKFYLKPSPSDESKENVTRVPLQSFLLGHELWKPDTRFWEESFFTYLNHKMMDAEEEGNVDDMQKHIVLACLTRYAQTMIKYDVDKEFMHSFVQKHGHANMLSDDEIEMLTSPT